MTLSRSAFLAALPVILVCLASPFAWADWRAEGAGVLQAGGVRANDPGRENGAGHMKRADLFGGYALRGALVNRTPGGMEYGLGAILGSGDYQKSLDRPGDNEGLTLNEVYLFAESEEWGRVRLGDEDGAAKRAVDLLPLLAGGQMDGFWTRFPAAAPPADHLGRDSDDATKLLYETPRRKGLRAGVSWAPERRSLVEDIRDADDRPSEDDFVEFGLNYQGEWRAWSYELAGGYGRGQPGMPGIGRTETVKLAGLALYGGFALGAVWFDDGDSGRPEGRFDTSGWTLQGTYENGPYGVTLFRHASEAEDLVDYTAYGLGMSWRIRPELILALDLIHHEADRHSGPVPGRRSEDGEIVQLMAEVRF